MIQYLCLAAYLIVQATSLACAHGEAQSSVGDCIPCSKLVPYCESCISNSTRCVECSLGHFLHENTCIKGKAQARCTQLELCADADTPICEQAQTLFSLCASEGHIALKCFNEVLYEEPAILLVQSVGDSVQELAVQAILLRNQLLKCAPVRQLREQDIVQLNAQESAHNVTSSVELILSPGSDLLSIKEGAKLILTSADQHLRVEFTYLKTQPAPYVCFWRSSPLDTWHEGCSLLDMVQHPASPLVQPVLQDVVFSVDSSLCFGSMLLLTETFVVLGLFAWCVVTRPKQLSIVKFRRTANSSSFHDDSLEQVRSENQAQIVIYSSLCEYQIHSGSVWKERFVFHHLILGQNKEYLYEPALRNRLWLTGTLIDLTACAIGWRISNQVVAAAGGLLLSQVVVYTSEALLIRWRIVGKGLVLLVLCLVAALSWAILTTCLDLSCSIFAGSTFLADAVLVQSAIALGKAVLLA